MICEKLSFVNFFFKKKKNPKPKNYFSSILLPFNKYSTNNIFGFKVLNLEQ